MSIPLTFKRTGGNLRSRLHAVAPCVVLLSLNESRLSLTHPFIVFKSFVSKEVGVFLWSEMLA